jgi:DUF1009 family protein
MNSIPKKLGLIAGKGSYPLLLAESARAQGVEKIYAVAFRGETSREIERLADEVRWVYVGQIIEPIEFLKASGVVGCVMAGQITPRNIFKLRLDSLSRKIMRELGARHAHSIFGAVADECEKNGLTILSGCRFMEMHMADAGLLTRRAPDEREQADIAVGLKVARAISDYDVGQSVAVKDGVILTVEDFDGTNKMMRRAGKIGGPGAILVKVAKTGHDMRFDIPIIGTQTLKVLKKAKATAIALEAGRAIILDKQKVIEMADALDISIVVMERSS